MGKAQACVRPKEKGACRVALNTAILQNKIPIETLFREFASQAIVFSPSIRVQSNGEINFYINAGRELIKPVGNLSAFDYISSLKYFNFPSNNNNNWNNQYSKKS